MVVLMLVLVELRLWFKDEGPGPGEWDWIFDFGSWVLILSLTGILGILELGSWDQIAGCLIDITT